MLFCNIRNRIIVVAQVIYMYVYGTHLLKNLPTLLEWQHTV